MKEVNLNDMTLNDNEQLETTVVDYKDLTKQDLIKLCEEKDKHITAYENERKNNKEIHDKELQNMNDYYIKKIKELTSLVKYYERKQKVAVELLTIEIDKGGTNNDTVQ